MLKQSWGNNAQLVVPGFIIIW